MPLYMLFFGDLLSSIGADANMDVFLRQVYTILIIGAVAFVLGFVGVATLELVAERQVKRIKEEYFSAVSRQERGWFDMCDPGTLTSSIFQNSVQIRDGIGQKLGLIFMYACQFVAGYAVGFYKDWRLALVMMAAVPLIAASGAFMMFAIKRSASRRDAAYEEAGSVAEEAISSIRTVSSFSMEEFLTKKYFSGLEKSESEGIKGSVAQGLGIGSLFCVMFLSYALGFWFGGTLVVDSLNSGCTENCVDGGTILTVFFSIVMSSFALGQLAPNLNALISGANAAQTVFELVDRKSIIDPTSDEGIKDVPINGEITLKSVKFAFPSRSAKMIFKDINITIPHGKTVALVGSSGSGKSTVVSLIERFYDPLEGTVEIGGVPLTDLNVRAWRNQIGIVSQEPRLFSRTIAANIAFGKAGATQEEIEAAAKSANAHDFIMQFPDGYQTNVGEGGGQLSGGQKQRVAIARAMIRDPPILILDEATSALDNQSERIVQDALDKLLAMRRRTTIIIAHRLSTIKNADIIIVLDNADGAGSVVVEQGTHSELMKLESGLYRKLVESQSMAADTQIEPQIDHEALERAQQVYVRQLSSSNRRESLDRLFRKYSMAYSSLVDNTSFYHDADRKGSQVALLSEPRKVCGLPLACLPNKKTDPSKPPRVKKRRMFAELKHQKLLLVVGVIAACCAGVLFPLFAIVMSNFIEVFFEKNPQVITDKASTLALWFVGLAAFALISCGTQAYAFGVLGERIVTRMRKICFSNVVYQEIEFFDTPKNSPGFLTSILAGDCVLLRSLIGDNLSILIQNGATLISALIIAYTGNAELASVVLAAFLIMVPATLLQMRFMTHDTKAEDSETIGTPGFIMMELVSNINTVQAFGLETPLAGQYTAAQDVTYPKEERNAILAGFFWGFSQLLQFCANALSLWYGGKMVLGGQIGIQQMMQTIMSLMMAGMGIGRNATFITDAEKAQLGAVNVYGIVDKVSKIDSRDNGGKIIAPQDFTGAIRFKSVNFRYPQRLETPVFKSISYGIKPGETVALVGASGCGKSTCIQLLERFYDVQASRHIDAESPEKQDAKDALSGKSGVFADGIDLRELNLKSWRNCLGLVSQEPILFNGTIGENIAHGKPGATIDEIIQAAQMSNAHTFIMTFPDGYDTPVGKGGGKLSGGQKQRVAIARAILRDPKILLLDEATSALDAESERIVQEALDKLLETSKRTTVVIAHRLSTVKNADKIIVLSNEDKLGSKVVEVGNHNELMQIQGGVYKKLVEIAQATH